MERFLTRDAREWYGHTCVVNVRYGKCGQTQWAWTNLMEPLCKDHSYQRHTIQNIMILIHGLPWGGLVNKWRRDSGQEMPEWMYNG